jgi:hypothetical protein
MLHEGSNKVLPVIPQLIIPVKSEFPAAAAVATGVVMLMMR